VPLLLTVDAAAAYLAMTPEALRTLLQRHPDLTEPRYSRVGRAPRLYRLLTTTEVQGIGAFLIARCLRAYPGRGALGAPAEAKDTRRAAGHAVAR
jgi:hypothetical protein